MIISVTRALIIHDTTLSLQGVFVFDCPDSPQQQNSQSQIESRKEDFKRKDKGADIP